MGDYKRGAYGHGKKVQDWESYNPLGNKMSPFPEEKVCALCESKMDVIFPIAPKMCLHCVERIRGRADVLRITKTKLDLTGYFCDKCGRLTYAPTIVNTRCCHGCTTKLGNQVRANNIRNTFARKVFG